MARGYSYFLTFQLLAQTRIMNIYLWGKWPSKWKYYRLWCLWSRCDMLFMKLIYIMNGTTIRPLVWVTTTEVKWWKLRAAHKLSVNETSSFYLFEGTVLHHIQGVYCFYVFNRFFYFMKLYLNIKQSHKHMMYPHLGMMTSVKYSKMNHTKCYNCMQWIQLIYAFGN